MGWGLLRLGRMVQQLQTNTLTLIGFLITIIIAFISRENIPIVVGIFLIILVARILDAQEDKIREMEERTKKNEERVNIYKELSEIKAELELLRRTRLRG